MLLREADHPLQDINHGGGGKMSGLGLLITLKERAKTSSFWLWVLNRALGRIIPFNRPHGFRLIEVGDTFIRTTSPHRRSNHNHVRGIHACAIATVAEFSAGFLLLTKLDPVVYRLIMSRIEIDYHYQAKERIISESSLSDEEREEMVVKPLQDSESVSITMESRVKDISGNEIAIARTTWQIKRWDRVRTKV